MTDDVVTIGGVSYEDPFRAYEEDTEDVLLWQKEQDQFAQAHLTGLPAFDELRRLVGDGFVDMFSFHAPRPVGGRWWRRHTPPGRRMPVVEVADTATGPGRVVVDVEQLAAGRTLVLQAAEPSPDGRMLLTIFAPGGGGTPELRVFDADTGAILHDGIAQQSVGFAVWLPDASAFLYSSVGIEPMPDGSVAPVPQIFEQPLGASPVTVPLPLRYPHPAVWPTVSVDGRYAFINVSQTNPRPAYVKDLARGGDWQPFLCDYDGLVKGTVIGDRYVAVATDTSPLGRVVSIPMATPADLSTWTEVVAASTAKIASVTAVGDRVVLADFVDGYARLRVLRPDGTVENDVPLPGRGAVGKFGAGFILSILDDVVWTGDGEITFVYSSLTQGPAAYRYRLGAAALDVLIEPAVRLPEAAVVDYTAPSTGVDVPYRVVANPGSGPRPTIVTGYGGFNVPWLPCFSTMAAAWVRAGGVWVHAHLRGGGEFGEDWWRAGRMGEKQHTFDDLFAVAEDLVRRGITTTEQLGMTGSSNGGLLAGAAIAQRPDLFRAIVPQVPLLDALGCRRDPQSAAIAMADYGNPDDPEHAVWLRSWSPYQNLRDGVAYPAVLLDAGAEDTTCPPWHSRKFALRLQRSSTSGHRILLRVRAESGHNAMTEAQMAQRDAEELSFFAAELGLRP